MKRLVLIAAVMAVCSAFAAFPRVPRAAVKALKLTRGKPFTAGLVFIDGKYIEPPYVVERYGTALRVNGLQVTGSLIPWEEFLRTQEGAKIVKTEIPQAASVPAAPVAVKESRPVDDDPLADLFDDDPAPKAPAKTHSVRPAAPPSTVVTTSVSFDGEFTANEASNALLRRLNTTRTEIDAHLRRGGFICFGSSYSRVTGDSGSAKRLLEKLPEIMKGSSTPQAFSDSMRESGLVYFPDAVNREFYRNRADYLKLIERRRVLREEEKLNQLLNRQLTY